MTRNEAEKGQLPLPRTTFCWCRSHAEAVAALSVLKSDAMGGKLARLEVINIVNRVDRSAYNIVRLNGMWHHALNNENIILD